MTTDITGIPLGTIKGPGQTSSEYVFVTPDLRLEAKAGEFVYYQASIDGIEREIVGRVTQRASLRQFPDGFLADPGVAPDEVAQIAGFDGSRPDLFEITVSTLGYYDKQLGDFINPRVTHQIGTSVYLSGNDQLSRVLSKKREAEVGSLHVGSLLSRDDGAVPIVLDARAITSTHAAIIASTGSGKSYLAGVILEELLSGRNRAAVLVVDPHGEYNTLDQLKNQVDFLADGYVPTVNIIRPDQIKVRISSLTLADLRYLLPNLSEKMNFLLGRAYNSVRREKGDEKWALDDLLEQVEAKDRDDGGEDHDDNSGGSGTVGAVKWRLESVLRNSPIFDNFQNLRLSELFRPGLCTVLQLNEIDEREQRVIVATLLRRLIRARMDTVKKRAEPGSDFYLPYPTFTLIEEAHRFAPASGDVITSQVLKTILAEGRKFGVAMGLISQRPGRLDSDVLSQCMTQFIMRVVNPIDQNRIAESVENVGRDLLQELPGLSKGQVIVAGDAVNTPVLCRVRTRVTPHGADDPDAPQEWIQYFSDTAQSQRERDFALPAERPRRRGPFKST